MSAESSRRRARGQVRKKIFFTGWFLAAPIIFSATLFVLTAGVVSARSLEILGAEISAELMPNGDLKVLEERTIDFNGRFSGADQKIYFEGVTLYSGIQVSEGGKDYTLVETFPTTEPGTYAIKVFGSDYFMVDWSFEAIDERRTFTLEYTARDLAVVHRDVAEVYYKFIGDGWDNPTIMASATLTLPPGAGEGEVLAWGHGPLYGEIVIESPRKVTWAVAPLPPSTYLEGRVLFPVRLVPDSARFSGVEALPAILAEEKKEADRANLSRLTHRYRFHLTFLVLAAAAGIPLARRRRAANKGGAYRGRYYRELPGTYPPAVAGYLWNGKKVLPRFLTAHLLDLARREIVRIEEAPPGRQGGQKDYRLVMQNSSGELSELDSLVRDFFFETVAAPPPPGDSGDENQAERAVSFKMINEFAKKEPAKFRSFYGSWSRGVSGLAEKEDFFRSRKFFGWGCLVAPLVIAASIVVAFWWGLVLPALALFISPIIVVIASPGRYYTANGADQLARWKAFRRFLLHFSRLERSTVPSLAIWEHYLVYAVVLGVAEKVIRQLALVFPQPESGVAFQSTGLLAAGPSRSIAPLSSISAMTGSLEKTISGANSSAARAVAAAVSSAGRTRSSGSFSSRSGSGGGFSRGGGGGSGGGGGRFR